MNWKDILLQYYKPAFLAFGLAFLLILLALKIFPKLKLLDRPQKYGFKRAPIPYYGGLVIFLVFLITVIIFVPFTKTVIGLLIGASLIAILGFFDDLFGLNPWFRLCVQSVAALILVFFGIGILSINLPFFGVISFTGIIWKGIFILSALFTILWVMTIVNTMNFVDGVSGLSSGVSFVAGLTIFILSIHLNLIEMQKHPISIPFSTFSSILILPFFLF